MIDLLPSLPIFISFFQNNSVQKPVGLGPHRRKTYLEHTVAFQSGSGDHVRKVKWWPLGGRGGGPCEEDVRPRTSVLF